MRVRGRARASGTQRARATVATAEARVRIRVRTLTQGRERPWLRFGLGLGSGLGSILTGRERVWRRAAHERRKRAVGWQRGVVKHRRARRARARGARGGARGGGGVRATGGARKGGAACWRAYVGGAVGVGTHRIARQRDDALDEESARIEHALAGVRGRGRLGVG